MPTTVIGDIYTPESTSKPVVHEDLALLADQLAQRGIMRFASDADRTNKFAQLRISPEKGMVSYLADIDELYMYTAVGWVGIAQHKILRRARRTTSSAAATGLTLVPVLRLDNAPLIQGHIYRIATSTIALDGTVANDVIRGTITYTTDGSIPTIASPVLPGGLAQELQVNIGFSEHIVISTTYTATGAAESLSLLLCVSRATGSGNVQMLADGTLNIIELTVKDEGIDPGDNGVDL